MQTNKFIANTHQTKINARIQEMSAAHNEPCGQNHMRPTEVVSARHRKAQQPRHYIYYSVREVET